MLFNRPFLSIIVIFHNMKREGKRTLYSLSSNYQENATSINYEVIAIDNNSQEKLSPEEATQYGENFHYIYNKTSSVSPVEAINHGVQLAKGKYIMVIIDGARILSPGIFKAATDISHLYKNPFIYTLGLHLGPDIQNKSISKGYTKKQEDNILNKINWKTNGYKLFDISSLAGSSANGFFGSLSESNCFIMLRKSYFAIGGMNPAFKTPGGGLVNLDFYQKACSAQSIQPVMLLGEGTFHQIHGGVATNVTPDKHPMKEFQEEYKSIYGKYWADDYSIEPIYFGSMKPEAKRFILK